MRRLRRTLLAAVVLAVLVGAWAVRGFGRIAAGYAATITAVQRYGAGDELEVIQAERLGLPLGLEAFVEVELEERRAVGTARAFGVFESTARWRPGMGATREGGPGHLPEGLDDLVPRPPEELPWPLGSAPTVAELEPARREHLERVLEAAFVDPASGLPTGTHAVVVARGEALVAERYREGYGPFTPLLGWSMTKSVTASLVGVLLERGVLSAVTERAPVAAWQSEGDPRREITLEELLHMESGLEFLADYVLPWSDSLHMLFVDDDASGFAAAKPLEHEPGTVWSYSDGTSNILARLVRDGSGEALEEQLLFPQRAFFGPLRMSTALLGVDAQGTFVGSSLMQASARDWARFGLLYLRDGVFDGQRLLPEGWASYVARPAPRAPHGIYGAHFWRYDADDPRDTRERPVPSELGGIFYAAGHDDQYVWIDRARDLVVVRLGVRTPCFDPPAFLAEVVAVFDAE